MAWILCISWWIKLIPSLVDCLHSSDTSYMLASQIIETTIINIYIYEMKHITFSISSQLMPASSMHWGNLVIPDFHAACEYLQRRSCISHPSSLALLAQYRPSDVISRRCWVKRLQLETGCPIEDYFKLWVSKAEVMSSWKTKETNQANPCTHMVANLVSKRDPKIARNSRMSLGKSRFS